MRNNRGAYGAEDEDNEINLTPMLDVVFIMLIFFIVTASFIKEPGVQVSRPYALMSEKQEDAAILVAIRDNDEIWIDRNEVDPQDVRVAIERLHLENPKGSLVIQADAESTNEMLVVVMEAAKSVGVPNVAISTETN